MFQEKDPCYESAMKYFYGVQFDEASHKMYSCYELDTNKLVSPEKMALNKG